MKNYSEKENQKSLANMEDCGSSPSGELFNDTYTVTEAEITSGSFVFAANTNKVLGEGEEVNIEMILPDGSGMSADGVVNNNTKGKVINTEGTSFDEYDIFLDTPNSKNVKLVKKIGKLIDGDYQMIIKGKSGSSSLGAGDFINIDDDKKINVLCDYNDFKKSDNNSLLLYKDNKTLVNGYNGIETALGGGFIKQDEMLNCDEKPIIVEGKSYAAKFENFVDGIVVNRQYNITIDGFGSLSAEGNTIDLIIEGSSISCPGLRLTEMGDVKLFIATLSLEGVDGTYVIAQNGSIPFAEAPNIKVESYSIGYEYANAHLLPFRTNIEDQFYLDGDDFIRVKRRRRIDGDEIVLMGSSLQDLSTPEVWDVDNEYLKYIDVNVEGLVEDMTQLKLIVDTKLAKLMASKEYCKTQNDTLTIYLKTATTAEQIDGCKIVKLLYETNSYEEVY